MGSAELCDGEAKRRLADSAPEVGGISKEHAETGFALPAEALDPDGADLTAIRDHHVPEQTRGGIVSVGARGERARA
jgi:hypothetical protein